MVNSYEELKTVEQALYCIVFRGTVDGIPRLCYLQRNDKPLFFYNYGDAKKYFDSYRIATQTDKFFPWKKGKLNFPDAKVVECLVSEFEVVGEWND